jgi:thiosulfate/3-mercaptopyruvate sulfurtransferase
MPERPGAVIAPLVTTAWLRERLGDPHLVVVDCRWKLGEPGAGEPLWRDGHIPGAAFLDLDRDLAAPPGAGGRHPLPSASDFEAAARRAGISSDVLVVAYDEAGEAGAARLWWLLRHFGHTEATVLDGGLRAWREDGGDLRAGEEKIEPGDFTARPVTGDTASADDIPRADARGPAERGPVSGDPRPPVLLDARAPERYRGEVEPVDSVAGHIPGARSVPFAEIAPNGRFPPPDRLRQRFEAAGVHPGDDAVAYCGSGVTAAVLVLAAEAAGIGQIRLYPGSWSEWSGLGLPVERG